MANRTVTTWLTGDLISATKLNNIETGISQGLNWNATTGGTDSVYTLSLTPAPSAYYEGMKITVVPHTDNAGACTINVNSLGAISIKSKTSDPSAGMLKTGCPVTLTYSGTSFFLSGSAAGTATADKLLAGETATVATGEVITGTMPDKEGDNVALSSSVSGTTLKLIAPTGFYDGGDTVTITDADFVAGNLPNGLGLFGLTGNGTNAKRYASGSVSTGTPAESFITSDGVTNNYYPITVTGLTFTPSLIKLIYLGTPTSGQTVLYSANDMRTTSGKIQVTYNSTTYCRLDGTAAYVTSSGFRMPSSGGSTTYNWEAWE